MKGGRWQLLRRTRFRWGGYEIDRGDGYITLDIMKAMELYDALDG